MVKTFIIDEPILLSLGILGACFIPKGWRGSLFKTRAFWVASWLALGFSAVAAYSYTLAPDWMFMYLLPASQVPRWMVVYLFLIYYGLFLAGFFLGWELSRHRSWLPWCALLLGLAASVAVVIPVLPAYRMVASYEEFRRGGGIPLPQSAVAKNTLVPTVLLALSGIAGLYWARRQKISRA